MLANSVPLLPQLSFLYLVGFYSLLGSKLSQTHLWLLPTVPHKVFQPLTFITSQTASVWLYVYIVGYHAGYSWLELPRGMSSIVWHNIHHNFLQPQCKYHYSILYGISYCQQLCFYKCF